MTAIRFYTDEQVAGAVIKGLRQRGIDVLSVPEAGMRGATDAQHLALAVEQQRVLFTQDTDFLSLVAKGQQHCGIVYAPQRLSIGEIVRGLVLIYQVLEAGEMAGAVEFL